MKKINWMTINLSVLLFAGSIWVAFAAYIGPNTTLNFQPGTSLLTLESKQQLQSLVKSARSVGAISEIQVAAWSDNEVPREGENLSDADRNLARKRADIVKNYLTDTLKVGSVSKFNMAERSHWLARTFHTEDAELKSIFNQEKQASITPEEFKVFRDNGKAGVVVVYSKMKR